MQRIYCLSILLLCLSLKPTESKSFEEFGKEFGGELRTLTLTVGENLIKSANEYYDALLKDSTTSEDETTAINENINKLKEISEHLQGDDRTTLATALHDLRSNELRKIHIINAEKGDEISDEAKEAFETFKTDGTKLLQIYVEDIGKRWHELLETVPEEEQTEHEDYAKITKLIENLTAEDDDRSTLQQVLQAIFEAFGYDDAWKVLLESPAAH